MSPIRLSLLAVATLSVTLGHAEEYMEYTSGTATNPGSTVTSSPSNIGFLITLAPDLFPGSSLGKSTVAPSSLSPGSILVVDQNLDASNNGTLSVNGGEIHQQDFTYTAPVLSSSSSNTIGSFTYTGTGLKYTVQLGPTTVTSGSYLINASTPGSIILNSGTLHVVGTILGANLDSTLDFGAQPMTFSFSSLGTSSLTGYADGNAAGTDNDSSGHDSSMPGATGISAIDTDGAELLINLNGPTGLTTLADVNYPTAGIRIPISMSLTGNIYVSVPEISSVALIGMTLSGLVIVWIRRSKV